MMKSKETRKWLAGISMERFIRRISHGFLGLKEILIFVVALLTVIATIQGILLHREDRTRTTDPVASAYVEYAFDSGEDNDQGFTKRAYDKIKNAHELPDAGSPEIRIENMSHSEISINDIEAGIIERRTWGNAKYELAQRPGEGVLGKYRMLENGNPIFEYQMNFGSDGPIKDWRMVDGKPAFTFVTSCTADAGSLSICHFDIWYDGTLVSKKYGVEDPRYLFVYKNKAGFIVRKNGQNQIFYDGKFLNPSFDLIWTHNCCSYTEILPTVFENGTLLFYAKRGETTYLVETHLVQ